MSSLTDAIYTQLERISDWQIRSTATEPMVWQHRLSGEELRVWSNGAWHYHDGCHEIQASGPTQHGLADFLMQLADHVLYRAVHDKLLTPAEAGL